MKISQKLSAVTLTLFAATAIAADEMSSMIERARSSGAIITSITPIFNQLLSYRIPAGFKAASEKVDGDQYQKMLTISSEIEPFQPPSQLISISGSRGLTAIPGLNSDKYVNVLAGVSKGICLGLFNVYPLHKMMISYRYEASASVIACSRGKDGRYSESLVIAIRGERDYYTIIWEEKSTPSNTLTTFDKEKWLEKFLTLSPIKLCAIVPGERSPYASCT
ncbi:MAG: hypothetical protein IV110_10970 [Aquabacterium sp.]|uniref:hypothetical protein n=1 Tax=Aquabacterium sp. TaxID=1872578 RepID=UPI001D50C351|nr:hypothetical protein [Aquabacterium sp.]MBT9610553.1 hypothetical protein [Aquabacterium sp.]